MKRIGHGVGLILLLGAGMVPGCSDAPTEPPGPPAAVEIISGNDQVVFVAENALMQLPERVVARVTDAAGRPVPGVPVRFVDWGHGWANPDTVVTDADGLAATVWFVFATGWGVHRMGALYGDLEQGYLRALVLPTTVQRFTVEPHGAQLLPGDSVRLRTMAYLTGDRSLHPFTAGVTFASSNPAVLSVDSTGLVRAHALGDAAVTVRLHSGIGGAASSTTAWSVSTAPPTSCDTQGGTTHPTQIPRDTTWTRVGSPHFVPESAAPTGRLTLGPGALVCLAGPMGPWTWGGSIRIEGSETEPVLIHGPASYQYPPRLTTGDIRHARLFDLDLVAGASVVAEDVVVARGVVNAPYPAILKRVQILDPRPGSDAVTLWRGVLEDVTVRQAPSKGAAVGIRMRGTSVSDTLVLRRVRVEGAGVAGLCGISVCATWWTSPESNSSVLIAESLEVTGGDGYPVMIPARWMAALMASEGAGARLGGNRSDTAFVLADGSPLVPPAGIPWLVAGVRGGTPPSFPSLEVRPGASVTLRLEEPWISLTDVTLKVEGAPGLPAALGATRGSRWSTQPGLKLTVAGTAAMGSSVRHAVIRGFTLASSGKHTLAVSETEFTAAALELGGDGSSVRNAGFQGGSPSSDASLVLRVPDLDVRDLRISGNARSAISVEAPRVRIGHCVLSEGWVGVQVTAGAGQGVTIHDCDLTGFWGFGVRNLSPHEVDATGNWWGDPLGPLGPTGSGLSGEVRFVPFLGAGRAPLPSR